MRHRYIFCGLVWENPKISNYRLISSPKYSHGSFVRVNIPNDLQLDKYIGDSYSTTYDKRTIHELGCDCYILFNGKWRKFNWLKNIEPCWWFRVLEHIFGLRNCYDTCGWTDDVESYYKWRKEIFEGRRTPLNSDYMNYPHVKEDKKGLTLQVKLDPEEYVSSLRRSGHEDEWLKFYDEFAKELKENPNKEILCK